MEKLNYFWNDEEIKRNDGLVKEFTIDIKRMITVDPFNIKGCWKSGKSEDTTDKK